MVECRASGLVIRGHSVPGGTPELGLFAGKALEDLWI